MHTENKIIKDARVFTEHFIPRLISHREQQLQAVRDSLKPVLNKQPPRNTFFYGDTGTGKTSIARYVAEELSSYSSSILKSYINCWMYPSKFKILYTILQDIGNVLTVHRKGTPTDELFDILRKKASEQFCVIILDEADKMEDESVLYDLMGVENLGLILISNSETAFYQADSRVRSRLAAAENIEFPIYKPHELEDILANRAEWGLIPGVVKKAQLKTIAGLAHGDARIALNILRIAAEDAERSGDETISNASIEHALPRIVKKDTTAMLEMLNSHQRILFEIVSQKKTIAPPALYTSYAQRCTKMSVEPVVERTLRKYLERMVKQQIIGAEGKDRWRIYTSRE